MPRALAAAYRNSPLLATAAAALPAETGSTASLMAVLAALAAAVVGGLVLPL